jgi:hypothetical protein
MLFKRKPSHSQSISGSEITGSQVQMAQAGENLTQSQQGNQSAQQKQGLTTTEVMAIFTKIEAAIQTTNLSQEEMKKAINYLNAAKQEAQESEPDKELVAKNLKRMGDTLKMANETTNAGKTLWETVQPMLAPLVDWLGLGKHLIGF